VPAIQVAGGLDGSRRFVWASVSEYLVCWLVRGLSWFVLVLLVRGDRLLITLSLSGLFPGWCGVDLACWSSSVDRWGVCVCMVSVYGKSGTVVWSSSSGGGRFE